MNQNQPIHWLVTLGCVNQTACDLNGNIQRIKAAINHCRTVGSQCLCLPELSLSGYGCEDVFLSDHFRYQTEQAVANLVAETHNFTLIVGAPVTHHHRLYNAMIIIQNQQIEAIVAKKVLAEQGVYYESRWFHPWTPQTVEFIRYAGCHCIAFGDPHLSFGSMHVAIEICEEAWSSHRPLQHGPFSHVIFHASASHFALNKQTLRRKLVTQSSEDLCGHYLYTNLLGVDSSRMIYDGAALWGHEGHLLYESPSLTLYDGVLSHLPLQIDLTQNSHQPPPHVVALRPSYAGIRESPHINHQSDTWMTEDLIFLTPHISPQPKDHKEHIRQVDNERLSFFKAITLGMWDYLRKSQAICFVLSLSGGCDSSVMACLAAGMVSRIENEIPPEILKRRIPHQAPSRIKNLLYCVYQSTDYSSSATKQAAKTLCDALGIDLEVIDIQPQVNTYILHLEQHLNRPLSWKEDSLVLENIQARLRSPYPWMLANTYQGILLCTANRSEAAMGYTTMDGDTSGGLACISGVSKSFLLNWLRWVGEGGLNGILDDEVQIAAQKVLTTEPTAELRPHEHAQRDQADLMPYEILAQLETLMITQRQSPEQAIETLKNQFSHLPPHTLKQYVTIFCDRWTRSQWKRERLATGFHVDEMNVDPKSWCRYPVLSKPPQSL